MRVSSTIFNRKSLVVHKFLEGVPLLDVWQIDLENGGEGRALQDLIALIESSDDIRRLNPPVRFLFWLREIMGRVFRWESDKETQKSLVSSYVDRVDAELVRQSITEPGIMAGPARVMYQLENEALAEIINATIHGFVHLSFETAPQGYRAFLAVYAINTKWWSKYYMAMIKPFRATLVYPNVVHTTQRLWKEKYG